MGGDGGTPTQWASHHDQPEMTKKLIDAGADFGISNQWGRTPLHVAARRNCKAVAVVLLAVGADPNTITREGEGENES